MKKKYIKIYCILTLAAIAELFLIVLFNHGEKLNYYFFKDTLDTGMDFFNSILYTKGGHPYTQFGTIYPPLANLVFWFLSSCVPVKYVADWPDTFAEGVAVRGTADDLRVSQAPMLFFILFIMIVSVLFVFVFSYAYKNTRLGMINGIAFLFSFGSLYAFERGNIIIAAILFLFIFLLFYDSDRRILRETALIALAVSAGLKLYPALFGIVLILERRWKEAVRTVIYGILFFFVPFAFFDGVKGFAAFLKAMFHFVSGSSVSEISGYSMERLVRSLLFQGSGVFGFDYGAAAQSAGTAASIIKYMLILVLVPALFFIKERWKRLLYIGVILLLIQNSGNYTLLFLLPALFEFCRADVYSKKNWCYFLLFSLLCLPLPVFGTFKAYGLDYIVLIKQDAFLGMLLFICMDLILNLVRAAKSHKARNETLPQAG